MVSYFNFVILASLNQLLKFDFKIKQGLGKKITKEEKFLQLVFGKISSMEQQDSHMFISQDLL